MKRYIKDVFRQFLLQFQKVQWDFLALSVLLYVLFLEHLYDSDVRGLILYINGAAAWLTLRLYWVKRHDAFSEFEIMRPCSAAAENSARFLILVLFFCCVPGIIMILDYDYRFMRFVIELHEQGLLPGWLDSTVAIMQERLRIHQYNLSDLSFQAMRYLRCIRWYWLAVGISVVFARGGRIIRIPIVIGLCVWLTFVILHETRIVYINPNTLPELFQVMLIPVLLIAALWPTIHCKNKWMK